MKRVLLLLAFFGFAFSASLEEVRQSGVVRIAFYDSNPPFSQQTLDGSLEGFEIKMAQKIAEDLFEGKEYRIDFIPIKSSDRIPWLQEDKVDFVLANFTATDERRKFIDFTMPYFSINFGVLTRKGDKIMTQADLAGKKILVEKDSTGAAYFEKKGYDLEYCEKILDCYNMLKEGKGDAFGHDNVVVMSYPVIDHTVEVNIKNLCTTDFLAIGVRKDNPEMLSFLNQEMIRLAKEGYFKKLFDEDIVPFYKESAEKKYFLLEDLYRTFF